MNPLKRDSFKLKEEQPHKYPKFSESRSVNQTNFVRNEKERSSDQRTYEIGRESFSRHSCDSGDYDTFRKEDRYFSYRWYDRGSEDYYSDGDSQHPETFQRNDRYLSSRWYDRDPGDRSSYGRERDHDNHREKTSFQKTHEIGTEFLNPLRGRNLISDRKLIRNFGSKPDPNKESRNEKLTSKELVPYNKEINRLAQRGNIERIDAVFDKIRRNKLKPDSYSYSGYLKAYNNVEFIKEGVIEEILSAMKRDGVKPDVVIYTALIGIAYKNGDLNKGLDLLEQMKDEGIKPDAVTYTTLIGIAGKNGDLRKGLEFLDKMKDAGVKPNGVTYAILIGIASKNGYLSKGLELLKQMKDDGVKPNVVTYTTLIRIAGKNGDLIKGLDLLEQMKDDGVKPDVVTYNTLIWIADKNDDLVRGLEFLKQMNDDGLKPDVVTYTTLMGIAGKNGDLSKGLKLLKQMKDDGVKPDSWTYTTLIGIAGKNGDLVRGLEFLKQMNDEGVKPDVVTYATLMGIAGKKGDLSEGLKLLKQMKDDGVKPDVLTYNTLIGFAGNGDLSEAVKLLKQMNDEGVKPDVVTAHIFIDIYFSHQNLEQAERIFNNARLIAPVTYTENNPTINLHNFSHGSACIALKKYIENNNWNTLLVVTGQGIHSKYEPFEMKKRVIAFIQSQWPFIKVSLDSNEGRIRLEK